MNTQKPEKVLISNGHTLDVHSIFHTLQGEGPLAGFSSVFIRLAGCNLQCPACDTEYTEDRKQMTLEEIYNTMKECSKCKDKTTMPRAVVITGGEPFRQNITPLANLLVKAGFIVQIETNGTLPPGKNLNEEVVIVCSPKTGTVNPKLAMRSNCYKYVLNSNSIDESDGLPIKVLDHTCSYRVARPPANKSVYVQPMDTKDTLENAANIDAVRSSCMQYGYILGLQIHKIIGVK